MDGARDQYEERLKEVFESFDGSGLGSLSLEELSDLCRALQLEENTLNTLVHTLVQDQLEERIHFEQFKDALIHVLSKPNTDEPQESLEQDSPEVQPRFVKGSKRYGRRSAPEFIHANPQTQSEDEEENDEEFECDYRTAPRKRERWNADVSFSEEFEAEGQLHFWNPDEPTTPRGNALPVYSVEERLESACLHLSVPFNGTATQQQLHALCQHIGLEVSEDLFKCADGSAMLVQDFISCIVNHSKPPTPSGSTPYRQFKRLHSTQFDESGRRFSSALSSTIGPQLFSVLDDGSGHAPVENLLYRWMEEGICNSSEILQALDFDLEGKVNLSELTIALENELLSTKNSIHQVALVSFKAEIRHLLECLDLERREKDRIRFDLEKAEKLKSQLVSEVDERHTAIERNNEVNLRKLEQEYKDSMMALKSELNKEVELVQQQANQQREELEEEICKRRDDENFIKEHLSLTIKEKGRLETELLETTDKLMDSELQLSKVQKTLDVLKEKFGGLDPHSDELYQADDHLQHLRRSYEEQCRDFQDRIDELEAQLEEHQLSNHIPPKRESGQSLCDELNLTSLEPVSQEQESVNINLETEMLQQHQQEIENLRKMIYEEQCSSENELSHLSLLHQQEVQALSQDITREQQRANKLEAELSTQNALHQQELLSLTQEAQDARKRAECIEEKVQVLEEAQSAYEEQSRVNAAELSERKHQEVLEQSLQEQREQLLEERRNEERRLAEQWKREQEQFKEKHEELLSSQLEQLRDITDNECRELERRLREEWELEKEVLEEKSREEFQVLLEEKERKLKEEWELKRQELEEIGKQALRTVLEEGMEREERLRIQWEEEQTLLKNQHQDLLLRRLEEERKLLRTQQQESENLMMEHWERERDRLEEQHNETLHLCLERERNVLRDEEEKRMQDLKNEAGRVDEAHREAIRELSAKHGEERERLGSLLEKLRADIAEQRRELERQFSRRLKEVEVRFCAEQDTVTERFQVDICHLEQLYQSEIASLTQKHSADKALWEEQTNAADEKAKQQLKLLRETMNQLKMDLQLLETAYAQDIKALTDKNTQVQAELESFITAARTKDTDLTCEINQLKDHLTETMEARDLLLAQVTKLEGILKEAEKEKLELEKKLVAFTGRPDEASSSSEVMEKIQESEEMLHQDLNEGNGDVSKCHSNPGMKSSVSKVEEEAFCENAVLFDEDGEKDMLNCTNVSTEDASVEKARTVQRITNSDHILDIWNQKISAVVQNKSGVSPGLDGQTKYERRLAETEITNYQTENKIKTWESLELNLSETEIRQDVCLQESWGLKRDAGRLPNCAWNFSSEETIRESTTPSELKTTQRSCDHEGTRNIECVHTHEDEDFREQTKVPQKLKSKGQHRDSDMSDSPCKSILKNKVAAVVELEFYCLEFEKQNTQLRRALANLRGRSLQIHKQMQRQSNEICRLTKENSILSHKILTVGVEDQRRNPSDQRFKHVHQTKRTVQALRRQLSEPRRPSPQLEEENGSPQQNGERVLQQGVKLHLANERNGGFGREEFASRTEKELLKAELNIYAEKVIFLNSSVQTLNQQNTRLKSELHVTQEEREALKQEVVSLHKQMQSANEKIRHLEALSVKHRGLMKSAEQENSPLKREMEALHTQLLSTQNKTHLAVVLPSSGETRGPRHHDVPDFSTQDEREMVLLQMEDRMREVELTLRNLKVLLQEKVSQLKEQVIQNGESDVLIKDLYVENAQLLKALEKTEQRHKVVEKRNFLLEEKISSLNKIVRDLGPSPLTPAPYHFTRS